MLYDECKYLSDFSVTQIEIFLLISFMAIKRFLYFLTTDFPLLARSCMVYSYIVTFYSTRTRCNKP